MDSDRRNLRDRFFSDSKRYLHNSTALVRRIKQRGAQKEDIHELFRCIHSIKSEGAYLRLDLVTAIAHELETKLDAARGDIKAVDEASIHTIEQQLVALSEAIEALEKPDASGSVSTTPSFNMFEKKLLNEAHRRRRSFLPVDMPTR